MDTYDLSPHHLSPLSASSDHHGGGGGGLDYLHVRERRHSSTSINTSLSRSSSYSNLNSSHRHKRTRRGSGSRVSLYDDDDDHDGKRWIGEGGRGNGVTIMSFLEGTRDIFVSSVQKTSKILSSVSRKTKSRPKIVCEGEILEQTSMVCRDYVVHKLKSKDLVSKKLPISPAHWSNSVPVMDACLSLEYYYPRIFNNISRKLCMTMTSTKVVRSVFNCVLDSLFEGEITWGKILSMFSVCSLFAEECTLQGHLDFVPDVVDVVVDFTNSRLLEWLVTQGGWECFPKPAEQDHTLENFGRSLFMFLSITLLMFGCSIIVLQHWLR